MSNPASNSANGPISGPASNPVSKPMSNATSSPLSNAVSGPVRNDELLTVVLDELIPAVDSLSGAGAMGLASGVRRDAAGVTALQASLDEILAALPGDFAALDSPARIDVLRTLEDERPRSFDRLVNLAYNAYYTDPRVLARIESLTGYVAAAPQPSGYELNPFDERLLDQVRQRPPSWRNA